MSHFGDKGSQPAPGSQPASGPGTPWLWATGLVLTAVLFGYPLLLDLPLIDPDEGFHASVSQEMLECGDWITPRVVGEPFFDKPALFFWIQASSLRVFGMNEAAVRLPGLLFGLLASVATGVVGWRMLGRQVGLVAAMIYATTVMPLALAQCAAPDVILVPLVGLSILLFWEADRATSRRTAAACAVAAGVLLGLSALTKGLVGIVLVGAAYGSYLIVTRRWTAKAFGRAAVALPVAAAVAAWWYAAMEVRNPGYLYYFFVERHFLGYLTGTQNHGGRPMWYYLPILLGGGLPWVAYLPSGVRDWCSRRTPPVPAESSGAVVLLLCWLISSTLFFSLASSKLVTYIWPVFPAMAILAAAVWVRLIEGKLSPPAKHWFKVTLWILCVCGPLLVPIGMLVAQSELDVRFRWMAWTVGLATAMVSLTPLGFWSARRFHGTLASGSLAVAAQFAFVMTAVAPHAARVNSARDLAQHFNRVGELPPRLVVVEERVGSLLFYLAPSLRAALRPGQFEPAGAAQMPELSRRPSATVIAVADTRLGRTRAHFDLTGLPFQRAGRYRLYRPTQLAGSRSAASYVATGQTTLRR